MASRKTPARGGSSKTPARKAATTAKGAAGKSTDRTAGKSAGKIASKSAKTTAARAARRNTDSGPASLAGAGTSDLLVQQGVDVQAGSAALPYNVDKASEYGRDNALAPPEGAHVKSTELASASTLSETSQSTKTGSRAPTGRNATIAPLDRVRADSQGRAITTNQGVPVAQNQDSLKAGLRGPALLKDFILREKITHFDHERIPERIVHARGSGAHGFFECYRSLRGLTRAAPFQEDGKITPVFVRFS